VADGGLFVVEVAQTIRPKYWSGPLSSLGDDGDRNM